MARNEKIEQWLASRRAGEMERLRKLEEDAAEAWFDSLSVEQREVFAELLDSHAFLWKIRSRMKQRVKDAQDVGFR